MAHSTSLWMGDLPQYMDENFIMSSFRNMGENALGVRIMKNKYTGQHLGYCFIHFPDEKTAENALIKCHGKVIPGSSPPMCFKLNHASGKGFSAGYTTTVNSDKDYVLWISGLTPEVDDYALYKVFATRYNTTKVGKVVKDEGGSHTGYGFVKFGSEEDQKDAAIQMNGFRALGKKSIKVSLTAPNKSGMTTGGYCGYISPSMAFGNYSTYQSYGAYFDGSNQYANPSYSTIAEAAQSSLDHDDGEDYDDYRLVEYDIPLDVEGMNKDMMEKSLEFWDALDSSRWLPTEGIETITTPLRRTQPVS